MSVVSLVKDLSMKKFNGITAVCFVDSVYSMLLYLLVYGLSLIHISEPTRPY